MKRKDVVSLVQEQMAAKAKIPKLTLHHELIKDNLSLQFEVGKDFKIERYAIYGNFSTFSESAVILAVSKIERLRDIINQFHNDEITIEDFNILLSSLTKVQETKDVGH